MRAFSFFPVFMLLFLHSFFPTLSNGQQRIQSSGLVIARVHYQGGGDWYNDPSAIPNLSRFIKARTRVDIEERETSVMLDDPDLFSYPVLFLTGHGNIYFSDEEIRNLRTYLLGGGFLYADDDYGMDASFRAEMKKVFPDRQWIEVPFSHGIYHLFFQFDHGLPKIHEHDNKPPAGWAILDGQNRIMVFYSYESNISDGWVDPDVHKDTPEKRETAMKMGANIILWAILN
jgi:hypothetical protein